MRKGFLFDHGRCVACGACKAGCFNENGWLVSVREIFTESLTSSNSALVTNLSLACNHCENALCMEGCPASCYTRDSITGAIIIDDKKCIGCKYCTWNCPYDAPRFDEKNKVIVKCNFCTGQLTKGLQPACSLACPTGALAFGEIKQNTANTGISWFPDKGLNPAIELAGSKNRRPVKIVPEDSFDNALSAATGRKKISDDLSLVVFTYLMILSVSFIGSSLLKGIFPGFVALGSVLLLAMISSLFHLGKWSRAWKAISNLKKSPLSREILLFVIFSSVSLCATFFRIPVLMPVSAIAGLFLLITIDRVYTFADYRKEVYLHSGQTFPAALLIISFASGMLIPFIFIAVIRLGSAFYLFSIQRKPTSFQLLRFLRIVLLLVAGAGLIRGYNSSEGMLMGLILAGELIDRLLFYADFSPLNIKTSEKII